MRKATESASKARLTELSKDIRVSITSDKFESSDAYLQFLRPRFEEGYRVLHPQGSFFLHIDYREVHYCKVMLDEIFGRAAFMNEIIWAYDYGGRPQSRWPAKPR